MKLTAEEHLATIKQRLEEGASYRTIARELGCSKDTVSIFAQLHLPDLRRRPTADSAAGMKVLLIDIETRPNLGYVWGLWQQNVGLPQLVESAEMLCFAAKWLDDPVVRFYSTAHDGPHKMIEAAHKLLDRADAVMHYNGRRFDVPHLNREFVEHGLAPPSPFKQIDLINTVKRCFKFPSNKLAYVSEALGLEGKAEHEGFELWIKCMAGEPEAWATMREYNEQDVLLVEQLYYKLLPWIERHPSHAAMSGQAVCPNCGSDDLTEHGAYYTKTGRYQQFKCQSCGKFARATKREGHTTITEAIPAA